MQEFFLTHYLWIKALHIIAVMSWMAGMLYLPRLFVYHAGAPAGSPMSDTFKIMERRLLRFIINPAMILSFVFGGLMLWTNPELMQGGWMHVKLTAIIALTATHGLYSKWRKDFAADRNTRSAKFYKYWNEVPTLLMVIIVLMAVAKPF